MNTFTFWVSVFGLLTFVYGKQLNCFTGYKILVRQTVKNKEGETSYRLVNKCLCPNDYFGYECDNHAELSCYLNSLSTIGQINSANIRTQMNFDLQLSAQCWVNHQKHAMVNVQLRQYLSKSNSSNQFGVRQQFGQDYQIVWANTTQIFDKNGELKAVVQNNSDENQTEVTPQDIHNILIGNNSLLYQTPFIYKDYFMGYGLVDSNVVYQVQIIDPEYGSQSYANFSNSQVTITGLPQYVKSYNDLAITDEKRNQIVTDFTNTIKNGNIQDVIKQLMNARNNPQPIPYPTIPQNPSSKLLPKIKIPLKLKPYTQTFYDNIRVQLDINGEQEEQGINQKIGLNALLWTVPVQVEGIGKPIQTSKQIIVTDQTFKSYYKIVFVVFIAVCVYLTFTFAYKRYKKWKIKQYTSSEEKQIQDQESIRSSSTSTLRPIEIKITWFNIARLIIQLQHETNI